MYLVNVVSKFFFRHSEADLQFSVDITKTTKTALHRDRRVYLIVVRMGLYGDGCFPTHRHSVTFTLCCYIMKL